MGLENAPFLVVERVEGVRGRLLVDVVRLDRTVLP
jgi:hypothetical protein